MPKGHYQRKSFVRTTKETLNEFIKFCHQPEIIEKLKNVKRKHQLAVKLYENATGIKISAQTAYKNLDRIVNCEQNDRSFEDFIKNLELNKHNDEEDAKSIGFAEQIVEVKHKRISLLSLKDYVRFTFRDNVSKILNNETIDIKSRVTKVLNMYKEETNNEISLQTAMNQINKWEMIDNEIVKTK